MKTIKSLEDFYLTLEDSRDYKRDIVLTLLNSSASQTTRTTWIDQLKKTRESLEAIPKGKKLHLLSVNDSEHISVDLSYEIDELTKDMIFLEQSEEKFYQHLEKINPHFNEDLTNGTHLLKNHKDLNFITDRDGTINNYCGRYRSSIQSVYNAVFLSNFARTKCHNALILTAAPLRNIGLTDVSILPNHQFIYAGSKGRECFDIKGKYQYYRIDRKKRKKLDELNDALEKLLKKDAYNKFSLIGSGFQKKFGQTTIARQNISKSIPPFESINFVKRIQYLVDVIDPDQEYFYIEDTQYDLEIILLIDKSLHKSLNRSIEFKKGDGIAFLDKKLKLRMNKTPNLICGDTRSDVPMLEYAKSKNDHCLGIFIMNDKNTQNDIKKMNKNTTFVHSPDALVSTLNQVSKL